MLPKVELLRLYQLLHTQPSFSNCHQIDTHLKQPGWKATRGLRVLGAHLHTLDA